MATVQVGIQLPEVERRVEWAEYVAMATAAERVGFDSIWLGDHLLYDRPDGPVGPWECWTLLAGLAAVTDRVLLGPLVSPTGFRNPALLAKMAATVDEMSGGRLVLGLGAGWNRREFDAFGFPFDHRVDRFEEAFSIIVDLIRTGRADFVGSHHRVEDCRLLPPARPELPIMIGSSGPRMLGITADHIDWWNEWFVAFGNDPARLEGLVRRVRDALERAGRDPRDVVMSAAVYVDLDAAGERPIPEGVEPIGGSSEQIAERLASFSGIVDHLQLVVDPITLESIERLGPVIRAVRST